MKTKHLVPIFLMPVLVSCTAYTYLPHLPAEPMYTGKEKAQAQVMMGPRHAELQLSGTIKHIGASANLYFAYTSVSAYSQEYSLHAYTSLGKKFYGSLTGGYGMARVGQDAPVNPDQISLIGTRYEGTSEYHGFHLQPSIYFVIPGKKKEKPREFKMGMGTKFSGLQYIELSYLAQNLSPSGNVLAEESLTLTQPSVYYFCTPYLVFQRTKPSGFYIKAYLGGTLVIPSGANYTRYTNSVGSHPSTSQVIQYPEYLPLLLAASVGFVLR